ncbi:MAG: aminoglycoside 6-adenylyltransferase [Streptococcaceae bacterium]|jgi:aminoglycoside 6-adenylyltransferase|nr:aminoglycoside 6-adenylyltransferase [Streptococcaceae bacterium]
MKKDRILQFLLNYAESQEAVSLVWLDGSRAFGMVDDYSDYDILFVTRNNKSYLNKAILPILEEEFGDIAVMQVPDNRDSEKIYTLLMQFQSSLRIDLTFQTYDSFIEQPFSSSKATLLMDKDGKVENPPMVSDVDFQLKKPTEAGFQKRCNEFWWLAPYLAKAVARGQLLQALEILNRYLRPEYAQMLGYLAGAVHDFQAVNLGKSFNDLNEFLPAEKLYYYDVLLASYAKADLKEISGVLSSLMTNYARLEAEVAELLTFSWNELEAKGTQEFISKGFLKWDLRS